MAKAQGVNTNRMKVLGLLISNGCIALSGALVFQFQGFADISMGIGVIVVALASVIIGEVIYNDKNNYRIFLAVVLGSILYRILIAIVLTLGINPHDFRLFSALILATALSVPLIREKLNINLKKQLWGRG
jgi:putative ABC transport system permease protein